MILGGWIIAAVSTAPPIVLPVIGSLHAWQSVFFLVGLPGLLIALLMATVREPERRGKIRVATTDGRATDDLSIRHAVRYLLERWQLYGSHFLGMSVVTCIGYGFLFWVPTMFVRTWQWDIPQISLAYGAVNLVAGPIGVLSAGWLADRVFRLGRRDAHMRTCIAFSLLFVPGSILAPLMPTPELTIAVLIPASIGAAGVTAMGPAALMMVTPNQLRAQATALYYFVINIIGLSIGGTAVGAMTDYVFGDESALRYTLAIVAACAGVVAFVFLTLNLRFYRRAMDESNTWSN